MILSSDRTDLNLICLFQYIPFFFFKCKTCQEIEIETGNSVFKNGSTSRVRECFIVNIETYFYLSYTDYLLQSPKGLIARVSETTATGAVTYSAS